MEVQSSDGHACGIPVQVDDHPTETRPYAINQIADSLLIDRSEILDVLESGTPEQLQRHLSRYTAEELKPLRMRQTHATRLPFPED